MPEKNPNDASSGNPQAQAQAAVTAAATTPAQPKVEVKDGVVLVDGKKFVAESDLIAAKKSLQGDIEKAQATHNEAVDKLRLQVDEANKNVATANAALEEAKKARESGATSAPADVAKVKQEADAAKADLTKANTAVLDLRRRLIMTAYNISPTSDIGKKLSEKSLEQLDSFEEALKALNTGRGGAGNYALGGGNGGAGEVSAMDRAKTILANTPVRGVRNAPAK